MRCVTCFQHMGGDPEVWYEINIDDSPHKVCGKCFVLTKILDQLTLMANPHAIIVENRSPELLKAMKDARPGSIIRVDKHGLPLTPPEPLNPEEE